MGESKTIAERLHWLTFLHMGNGHKTTNISGPEDSRNRGVISTLMEGCVVPGTDVHVWNSNGIRLLMIILVVLLSRSPQEHPLTPQPRHHHAPRSFKTWRPLDLRSTKNARENFPFADRNDIKASPQNEVTPLHKNLIPFTSVPIQPYQDALEEAQTGGFGRQVAKEETLRQGSSEPSPHNKQGNPVQMSTSNTRLA